MLMVIFGAGASYDSAPDYPPLVPKAWPADHRESRPPLANELFENRPLFADVLAAYSDCHAVITRLRDLAAGSSVEHELEELQMDADEDPRRKIQLAAIRFYLQQLIWTCEGRWNSQFAKGITNYKTLLGLIQHLRRPEEKVCLVTFNYDIMLEQSLPFTKIRTFTDYIAPPYIMIKLHGSVNWAHPVRAINSSDIPRTVPSVIEKVTELEISREYIMATMHSAGRFDAEPYFPALAIPVERKKSYECPDIHLDALRTSLPEVHKTLVIGWNATEEYFLHMLSEELQGNVLGMVVNGGRGSAEEVIKRLKDGGVRGEFTPSDMGFTDFMRTRQADEFLKK